MPDVEKWDERYRTGNLPWDTGQPSSELVRAVQQEKIAPCRAIDLGCGTGTNVLWLAQQGFQATGVDLSPTAVARAQERAVAAGVSARFLAADITGNADLGGPFDFFFDRGCYHCVRGENVEGYLQTLQRITAPGALGLVLAGNARQPEDPGPPVVTEEELRGELGRIFDIVWLRECRFDPAPMTGDNQPLAWSCLLRRPVPAGV